MKDEEKKEERIPVPPIKRPIKNPLYLPVDFWTSVVSYLDARIEEHGQQERFVMLGFEIRIQKGRVVNHKFTESITNKELIEKATKIDKDKKM